MSSSWDRGRQRKVEQMLPVSLADWRGNWADIGCGDGAFSRLLCERMVAGSTLYAVDKSRGDLSTLARTLQPSYPSIQIETRRADFTKSLDMGPVDGMLLINSLHYVRRRERALKHLTTYLTPNATVIIIEYNASRGNYWVPFAFNDRQCLTLMGNAGLKNAQITHHVPNSSGVEFYVAKATWMGPNR